MLRTFLDDGFLLGNDTAKNLFHKVARDLPIYDYHCHLDPKDIALDLRYENITQLWLYGDHYKWRAMRSAGIDERYITGDSSDYEKFLAWAKVVPKLIGNPLYHWTHLELMRYFGIYEPLSEKTAPQIWEKTAEIIKSEEFSVCSIINRSNVALICTTDDPADDLKYHQQIKKNGKLKATVLPCLRPDKYVNIQAPDFVSHIEKLSKASGIEIINLNDLIDALYSRIEYFHKMGCRLSDHAFAYVPCASFSKAEVNLSFKQRLKGKGLTYTEAEKYMTYVMLALAKKFKEKNWTMQLHIGAQRNNNSDMFTRLGPDTGFDCVYDGPLSQTLVRFLDRLNNEDSLCRTVLYTLNPTKNTVIGTIMGCFQKSDVEGYIQFGSAWWFNDHIKGMRDHMTDLASLGVLSTFVGMLTDSRSFLSYPRHEYFRRILCNLLGEWAENGEYPNDMESLSTIVEGICYKNAVKYFNM